MVGQARYAPYGGAYWSPSVMATDRRFTGHRSEDLTGLIDMNARYFDPLIGRFISADTIVPGAGNPQTLNRYSYGYNSPLNFVDPNGHDPLDADWEAAYCSANTADCAANNGHPTDEARQIRLFSLIRTGPISGNRSWTADDWAEFNRLGRNHFFLNEFTNHNSLGDFQTALRHLSDWYADNEAEQFVSGIALLYAGVPYDTRGVLPVFRQALGQTAGQNARIAVSTCHDASDSPCHWLGHRSYGFSRAYASDPLEEQTHHYAGHLLSGYWLGQDVNRFGTDLRELRQGFNPASLSVRLDQTDVALGYYAGDNGYALAQGLVTPRNLWIAVGALAFP